MVDVHRHRVMRWTQYTIRAGFNGISLAEWCAAWDAGLIR